MARQRDIERAEDKKNKEGLMKEFLAALIFYRSKFNSWEEVAISLEVRLDTLKRWRRGGRVGKSKLIRCYEIIRERIGPNHSVFNQGNLFYEALLFRFKK